MLQLGAKYISYLNHDSLESHLNHDEHSIPSKRSEKYFIVSLSVLELSVIEQGRWGRSLYFNEQFLLPASRRTQDVSFVSGSFHPERCFT